MNGLTKEMVKPEYFYAWCEEGQTAERKYDYEVIVVNQEKLSQVCVLGFFLVSLGLQR